MNTNNTNIVNKMNFEINKYEIIDEVSESKLTKIKLWIARDGENRHNKPITKQAILDARKTLVGKPILASLNWTKTDFLGHEDNEVAVGVILNDEDIVIEEIDGETWTIATGYIWKKYYPKVVEVLKYKDGGTSISMEITMIDTEINEDKQEVINTFVYDGVTLIGTNPAIPEANAQVLKFSEMIKETKKILKQETKLTASEKIKNAINKVNSEEGDKVNFEEEKKVDSVVYMEEEKETEAKEEEKETTTEETKTEEMGCHSAEMEMEVKTEETEVVEKMEEETDETKETETVEEEKEFTTDENAEGLATQIRSEGETKSDEEEIEEDEKTKELRAMVAEMESKVAELSSENTELKAFKDTILKQEKTAKAVFELNEIAKKKVISEEKMSYWTALADEYEDIEKWCMELKAEAFGYDNIEQTEKFEKKETFIRMDFNPYKKQTSENGNVWDKAKQKYNK